MRHVLRVGLLVLVFAVSAAADTGSERGTHLALDLQDGSRLLGSTTLKSLVLHTEGGELTLALDRVRGFRVLQDRETAVLEMRNGDRLTGVLDRPKIGLQTVLGGLEVPLAVIRRCQVRARGSAEGLMLHYDFDSFADGIVRDLSGHGNHARLRGGARIVPSAWGHALRISGPDDYLVCEKPKLDVTGWQGLTVSVWICIERHTTYNAVLHLGRLDGRNSHGIHLQGGHRHPSFAAPESRDGRPFQLQTFNPSVQRPSLRTWHHLVGVVDHEACRLYIDGRLGSTTPRENPGADLQQSEGLALLVGKTGSHRMTWRDSYLDGRIDELEIWDHALSPEVIQALSERVKWRPVGRSN